MNSDKRSSDKQSKKTVHVITGFIYKKGYKKAMALHENVKNLQRRLKEKGVVATQYLLSLMLEENKHKETYNLLLDQGRLQDNEREEERRAAERKEEERRAEERRAEERRAEERRAEEAMKIATKREAAQPPTQLYAQLPSAPTVYPWYQQYYVPPPAYYQQPQQQLQQQPQQQLQLQQQLLQQQQQLKQLQQQLATALNAGKSTKDPAKAPDKEAPKKKN